MGAITPRDFSGTYREKVGLRKMMRENSRILSNSAKFSAGRRRPLLSAYNFSTTVAPTTSTYRFGAVPSLKSVATENMSIMTLSIFAHRRLLEAHNFETALHIDKWLSDVSSRINALQNGIKRGTITQGVFLQPMENVGQRYKWFAKK